MSPTPSFNRGAAGIDKAQEEAKARRGSSKFTDRFVLDDGKIAVVRIITDAENVITIGVHSFVPTKPAPKGWKGDNYPRHMTAVCRKAPAFFVPDAEGNPTDEPIEGFDGHCFICEHIPQRKEGKEVPRYPAAKTFALAVLRKEVSGGHYEDVMRKVGEGDDEKLIPHIVVISQAHDNFWSKLRGNVVVYHTLVDRDYHIKRVGEGVKTDYPITPLDPDDSIVFGEVPKTIEDSLANPTEVGQHFIEVKDWPTDVVEDGDLKVRLPHRTWKFGEYVEADVPLVNQMGEQVDGKGRSLVDGADPEELLNGIYTLPPHSSMCRYDLRDPRFRAVYEDIAPDLGEIVMDQASERHYALFFDTTKTVDLSGDDDDGDGESSNGSGEVTESSDPTPDKLAALRARVSEYAAD